MSQFAGARVWQPTNGANPETPGFRRFAKDLMELKMVFKVKMFLVGDELN